MNIQRILVPVDFSDGSRLAVQYASELARMFKAEIHLLHVIEPIVYPIEYGVAPAAHTDIEETARRNAEKEMHRMAEKLAHGISTHAWIRIGRAADAITEVAKDATIDLIVMSTHGRTGVSHLLLGSTAERVVRLAPCPVLSLKASSLTQGTTAAKT